MEVCSPHCYKCAPATVFFARAAFIYVVACVGYLLLTRKMETPFHDSLTEEQMKIKKDSAKKRQHIFNISALAGLGMIVMWKPFVQMK